MDSAPTFTRFEVPCDRISATDLQAELAADPNAACYRLEISTDGTRHAETAEVVAFSVAPRIAIAWGGDSDWGDCNTTDDTEVVTAITEWLNDPTAWEARN